MAEMNQVDLTNLARDLRDAGKNAEGAVQQLLETAGNEIAAEAQNIVPVRTGRLKSSIAVTSAPGRVEVKATAPYSAFVEYGTRPHEIRPKSAKALRFKVQGQVVFATKVNHPGTKAQPFIRPAVQRWVGSLGERAADVGVSLITGKESYGS